MKHDKKDELLTLFSISLALVACSVLIYMIRDPSITSNVVLDGFDSTTTIIIVSLLILAGIVVVNGAIIAIHKLKKETEKHKRAIGESTNVEKLNFDLANYVLKAKQSGFNDKQILEKLKKIGWNAKDIKKYL